MLNRSARLMMSTSILKALPGKLDIKRHSPSILYLQIEKEREMTAGPKFWCDTPLVSYIHMLKESFKSLQ